MGWRGLGHVHDQGGAEVWAGACSQPLVDEVSRRRKDVMKHGESDAKSAVSEARELYLRFGGFGWRFGTHGSRFVMWSHLSDYRAL